MGGSVCGKTTLLRHLIGVMRPDSGEILVRGADITRFGEGAMEGTGNDSACFSDGRASQFRSPSTTISARRFANYTKLDEKIIA